MSSHSHVPGLHRAEDEYSRRHAGEFETIIGAACAEPKLTRVQIEALVSGEFTPMRLGSDLVCRLNRAWAGAGQRLHMLRVKVVHVPMQCPRCGDRALYRKGRCGFLEVRLYPLFGLYPWRCVSCWRSTLLRLRSPEQLQTSVFAPEEVRQTRRAA